jgi:hypothetical protein
MMLGNIPPQSSCVAKDSIKESDLNFQPQIDKLRKQQTYLWIAIAVLVALILFKDK